MCRRLAFCCIVLVMCGGCGAPQEIVPEALHLSYLRDKESYEELFRMTRATSAEPIREQVIGGVVPHHMFVGHEIARLYETLRLQSPSIVVIIGPNHFSQGRSAIQTTDHGYETPYGTVDIAMDVVRDLEKSGIAQIEPTTFDTEHSISTHVVFIKRTFPQARVVPIVMSAGASGLQTTALAAALDKYLPKDALVLASVDFSHYLPPDVAAFHDDYAEAVMEQFAFEHVRNLEIDSAPSIETFLSYLTLRKAQNIAYEHHTNSADFIVGSVPAETTSHFFMAFTKGKPQSYPFSTLLFFGDTITGRGIADQLATGEDPLKAMRGDENRFFRGISVVGANLEGPLTTEAKNNKKIVSFAFDPVSTIALLKGMGLTVASIANNHIDDAGPQGMKDTVTFLQQAGIKAAGYPDPCTVMTVIHGTMAICAFADLSGVLDLERASEAIRAVRSQTDFLVVSIHWGTEYSQKPTDRQRLLSTEFMNAGADAVIGHGPHVVQPIEWIHGKPVLYSVGNFLFDQPDPKLSNGIAAGLTFSGSTVSLRIFPLHTAGGRPRLEKP